MKKIFLLSFLVAATLIGCTPKQDLKLPDTLSARWKAEAEKTFNTLISAENGWYMTVFNGWSADQETGGYWFLCSFHANGTATVATERAVTAYGTTYAIGTDYTSVFKIDYLDGPCLTFPDYNPIMHSMTEPGPGSPYGQYGDPLATYQVYDVHDDYIKLRGIRTGKFIHLYRKDATSTMLDDMTALAAANKRIDDATIVTGTGTFIDGVAAVENTALIAKVNRTFVLNYIYTKRVPALDENGNAMTSASGRPLYDEKPETVSNKIISFIPSTDGLSLILSEPVTLLTDYSSRYPDGTPIVITGFYRDTTTSTVFSSDDGSIQITLRF